MERIEGNELHERLCAYALGEQDAAERAAVEAELARSPELRAELERIRGTLALVRGGLAGREEELSEEAMAGVLERARVAAGRARGWRRIAGGSVGRVAAAFAVVALGLVVWAGLEKGDRVFRRIAPASERGMVTDELAKLQRRANERDADASRLYAGAEPRELEGSVEDLPAEEPALKDQAVLGELKGLGYAGEAVASAPSAAPARPAGGGPAVPSGPTTGGAFKGAGNTVPPREASPLLAAGGEAGGKASGIFGARMGGEVQGGQEPTSFDVLYRYAEVAGVPLLDLDQDVSAYDDESLDQVIARVRTGVGPATPGPAVRTGSDEYFLGRKEKRSEEPERRLRELGYTGEDGDGVEQRDQRGKRQAIPYARLPEAERERVLEGTCGLYLMRCTPRPGEAPDAMFFRFWGDNPFVLTQLDALSTFGVDVDTASWPLARNYLRRGMLPPREAVRTEELLNSFRPELPAPRTGDFAVYTELAPSRFGGAASRWMLSVALKGREVERAQRKPLSLTFVVDVSGSMERERRLELVKHALRLLVAQLDGRDRIAVVAFSNEARLVLPLTSASQRAVIEAAVQPLAPQGGTNAEAGLKLGYEVALAGLDAEAANRVILLSDGVANVGQTDQERIGADVARHRSQGIYLNTIGVGMGNHNDVFLEQLADRGDGIATYVDDEREAKKALVEDFVGKLETIARDVKLQVEFDPAQVLRWRLLGYENRAIADRDFRNDAVDAGEVGAGHAVVALYELELAGAPGLGDGPLATVRVRWKPPFAPGASQAVRAELEQASEASFPVSGARATSWEGASAGFKKLAVVAQLAEVLRRSVHARDDSVDDLLHESEALLAQTPRDEGLAELVQLVARNLPALREAFGPCDRLCRAVEELRDLRVRQAELERLRAERDEELLRALRRQDAAVEARIRELVRERLERQGAEPK